MDKDGVGVKGKFKPHLPSCPSFFLVLAAPAGFV